MENGWFGGLIGLVRFHLKICLDGFTFLLVTMSVCEQRLPDVVMSKQTCLKANLHYLASGKRTWCTFWQVMPLPERLFIKSCMAQACH